MGGEAFLQGPAAVDVRGRGQTPTPSPQELVKGVGEKGSSWLRNGARVADAARASPSGGAVDLGPRWFWEGVTLVAFAFILGMRDPRVDGGPGLGSPLHPSRDVG